MCVKEKGTASDAKEKALKNELITNVAAAVFGNEIVINNTDFEAKFDGNVWSVQ